MSEQRTIEGWLFTELVEMGGKTLAHTGFDDPNHEFQALLDAYAPDPGTRRSARITMEFDG